MERVTVVHLVRMHNGPGALASFLETYLGHEAGMPHELLVLFKGFPPGADMSDYAALLAQVEHRSIHVADAGFDLTAYFKAARHVGEGFVCFLNSFSRILVDDWLVMLYRHAVMDGVGIVGATGSWGSAKPGRLMPKPGLPIWKRLLRPWVWRALRIVMGWYFPAFPNPHVRTNAFMLRASLMRELDQPRILTKWGAYKVESGKRSLTRQIQSRGLLAVVVDRHGRGYLPAQWDASETFWTGMQACLMVADNQTAHFDGAPPPRREFLETAAWGRTGCAGRDGAGLARP